MVKQFWGRAVMGRTKVGSVEEAVRAANELKRSGRLYWFRGQAKDWPLQSSLARVRPEDREALMAKLARYETWIKNTPGLERLAAETDAAIAVAQHYGLPTSFVDFTTEPEIAGFFAAEAAGPGTAAEMGCILCLDIEDLKNMWRMVAKRYPAPEFLKMAVPDLWRLEAQHGCFLFCPYSNLDVFYDADRILFPNTHPLRGVTHDMVYPRRKSHLEALLDQYFMNEQMIEGDRALADMNVTQVTIDAPEGRCDPEVFPRGIPKHPSWSQDALRAWLELREETFAEAATAPRVRIQLTCCQDTEHVVEDIAEQVSDKLRMTPGIRSKLVKWEIELEENHELPGDFASLLEPRLACLWDGLRRLPHDDRDLCRGMGQCAAFAVALKGDFQGSDARHWERAVQECLVKPIEVEFGPDDGSYSRGYASSAGLATAIRPDILDYVSDRWKDQMAGNIWGLLQTASDPRKTCDFRLLTPLFARELAPYQVLARDSAVFYSPARLVSLGLP
jgi:hypothetical protein